MTELETPSCPLCGSNNAKVLYQGEGFDPYGVKFCLDCGLGYLSPRLYENDILALYSEDHYFSGAVQGYSNYAGQEISLRATFRRLMQNLVRRGKAGGKFLEIGCGYGYLLDEAGPYFSLRVGTDFSAEAVRQASIYANDVYQGGIEAVPEADYFDCIVATHVIEHIYSPHDFVISLLKHLKTGGSLLIAAPDMASFWRRIMDRRWPSFKLPEHVLYFDQKTLRRLLSECGLVDINVIPYPHAFPLTLIASKLGWVLPNSMNRYSVWLPATTIALIGTKRDI